MISYSSQISVVISRFDTLCCVQVYWNSLSRTYWVHWHMVEILGSGSSCQAEKETQEKASSLTETLKLSAGEM